MAYIRRGEFTDHHIWKDNGKWAGFIAYANATVSNPDVPIDEKLDVHLRGNEVHVYYKGGRILKITPQARNFDPNYFYLKKEHQNIPRTWMEFMANNKQEELCKRKIEKEQCLSVSEAKEVFKEIERKGNELIAIRSPEAYFEAARKVMDKWNQALLEESDGAHEERLLQQKISVCNRKGEETDFIVIDIEFSVTKNESVNYHSKKYSHPRFDIIALQPGKNFRLAVIELKKGIGATGLKGDGSFNKNMKSGVQDHIAKFKDTLGSDKGYRDFVQEMEGVLSAKVEFGILPKELEGVKILVEKPEFYLAYAGPERERFKNACDEIGQPCICIMDEQKPLLRL